MSVEIVGNYPVINRKRTGLYSLDRALANKGYLGYPMRTATELYGYPNSGKSTLAYYLAGTLGEKGKVVICDLEMLDKAYIKKTFEAANFSGKVSIVNSTDKKGVPRSHEDMLGEMVKDLYAEGTTAGIWDSLGAVTPITETKGDFGQANWGKRAILNNQVSRALGSTLRNKSEESVFFGVNHAQVVQGGKGHSTPGGDGFKFVSAVRIMLYTQEVWRMTSETDSDPIGFVVAGHVEKSRYNGKGRRFRFYIVPGYGVHVGVSAMFDCFDLELAEQGTTVKIGSKSLGYIRKDLLSYAMDGRQRKFEPFLEQIAKYEKETEKELTDETLESK